MNVHIENVKKVEVNRFQFSPTRKKIRKKKKEVPLRKFLFQRIHRQKKQQLMEYFDDLRELWSLAQPVDDFQVLKLYLHTAIFQRDTFEFNCFGLNFKSKEIGTTTLFDYVEEDTWRFSFQDTYTRSTRGGRLLYFVRYHRRDRHTVLVTFWDVINFRASSDIFVIDSFKHQGKIPCHRYDDGRINLYLQINDLISLKNAIALVQQS